MSTKVTIKNNFTYGETNFHLYEDCMDDAPCPVYLQLSGVGFRVTNNTVFVEIPRKTAIELGLVKK